MAAARRPERSRLALTELPLEEWEQPFIIFILSDAAVEAKGGRSVYS